MLRLHYPTTDDVLDSGLIGRAHFPNDRFRPAIIRASAARTERSGSARICDRISCVLQDEVTMRAAIAVVCVSGVLVAACVSVNRSVLSRSRIGQPVPREQVRVIVDGDSVPPHETIAILSVQGDRNVTNDARLIEKLREEAGKLGANAILLGSLQDASTAAVIAQVLIGRPANRKGQAIAIYVAAFDRK